jgi:hypothetical protein
MYVDAPEGHQFQSGLHSLAITGTYEEMLVRLVDEMPVVACPEDCECRDQEEEEEGLESEG